jgi:hypothetical protein
MAVAGQLLGSWGSSVYVASDYRLINQGFDPRQRQRIFLLTSVSRPALEDHTAFYPVGTGGRFRGSKARPINDADQSPHLVPRSSNWSFSYSMHPNRLKYLLQFLRLACLTIAHPALRIDSIVLW